MICWNKLISIWFVFVLTFIIAFNISKRNYENSTFLVKYSSGNSNFMLKK